MLCRAVLCCLVPCQGGSVTPEAAITLSELRRAGLLEVCEQSEVMDAAWDWQEQRWDVWLQVRRGWGGGNATR